MGGRGRRRETESEADSGAPSNNSEIKTGGARQAPQVSSNFRRRPPIIVGTVFTLNGKA